MKKLNLLFVILLFCLNSAVYTQINNKLITSKKAIPNRYIVVLNNNSGVLGEITADNIETEKVRKVTKNLSLIYGGKVDKLYS